MHAHSTYRITAILYGRTTGGLGQDVTQDVCGDCSPKNRHLSVENPFSRLPEHGRQSHDDLRGEKEERRESGLRTD